MTSTPRGGRYVYVVLSYREWLNFKKTGSLQPNDELENEYINPQVPSWLKEQMRTRMALNAVGGADLNFVYACVARPPANCVHPAKRAILKVRVPIVSGRELAVMFDDHDYVYMLNTWGNGDLTYCADTEEEEIARNATTSDEEKMRSYEIMFDPLRPTRTRAWRGPPDVRAFLPWLRRDMVASVWVYRYGKRLRTGCRKNKKKARDRRRGASKK